MSYQEYFDSLTQMVLDLSATKEGLKNKYLDQHIGNQLASPDDFKFDVKSFCVLLHAAIEDFIEGVALNVYKASHALFDDEGVITIPFMYSLHHSGILEKRISEISDDDLLTKSENLRYPLNPVEYFLFSGFTSESAIHTLLTANHGISRKYLKNIIMMLGIHIDFREVIYQDWKSIAEYRGAYAHADISYIDRTKAKKPLYPEKCSQIGESVLEFSCKIVEWAEQSLNRNYKDLIVNIKDHDRVKKLEKEKELKIQNAIKSQEEERKATDALLVKKEKDEAKKKNIERVEKLDVLLKWIENEHPLIYKKIYSEDIIN
ncbi:hypothetical protein L8P34_19830 [Enterobacter kobei]|uniref:HEPN domain-containing protein n=2 Tax=Enterobacter TaxID=547 RepID=UPI00062C2430|nr:MULTISPECIES: HEPN domain-containing protein [Enterobacter cloacae complex]KKY78404.1 hypothetical protein OA44_18130 [Enterobacter cloacae]MCK7113789.1 hypothetical protein [Enterobacter kobei]